MNAIMLSFSSEFGMGARAISRRPASHGRPGLDSLLAERNSLFWSN